MMLTLYNILKLLCFQFITALARRLQARRLRSSPGLLNLALPGLR
jgi:hypothetical protein